MLSLDDDTLWVAADTETHGLAATYDVNCGLHCMQVFLNGEAFILTERADIQHVLDTSVVCFVNAAFDVAVLRTHGYVVNVYHDIALANYVLMGARSRTFNSLNGMSDYYLGKQKLEKPRDWAVFDEQAQEYALEDVRLTDALITHTLKKLKAQPTAWDCYVNIDLPYVETLIEMNANGVYVNPNELKPLVPVYEEAISEVVHAHTALHGFKQVFTVERKSDWTVFKGMPVKYTKVNGIPRMQFSKCDIEPLSLRGDDRQLILNERYSRLVKDIPLTACGKLKTDSNTLHTIEAQCPAATLWLEYESRTKQLNTFLLPLIELATTGKRVIRPSFHAYNTRTRRLSCSNPNLQQVPADGERGEEVRRAFIAPPGYKVVVGDLDRIELVVMAFYLQTMLGVNVLADRLLAGDVHQFNADAWMCSRFAAKRAVFLVIYGGGANKLANVIKCPVSTARQILSTISADLHLDAYRAVFVEQAIRNDGYISNYFGGKLYIPELVSSDRSEQSAGKRKAGNYPIQSTAGDVFKLMQIAARNARIKHDLIREHCWQSLVVHDEVVYVVKASRVDTFIEHVTPCYNSKTVFGGIEVKLKFGVSNDWYTAKGG